MRHAETEETFKVILKVILSPVLHNSAKRSAKIAAHIPATYRRMHETFHIACQRFNHKLVSTTDIDADLSPQADASAVRTPLLRRYSRVQ